MERDDGKEEVGNKAAVPPAPHASLAGITRGWQSPTGQYAQRHSLRHRLIHLHRLKMLTFLPYFISTAH